MYLTNYIKKVFFIRVLPHILALSLLNQQCEEKKDNSHHCKHTVSTFTVIHVLLDSINSSRQEQIETIP